MVWVKNILLEQKMKFIVDQAIFFVLQQVKSVNNTSIKFSKKFFLVNAS